MFIAALSGQASVTRHTCGHEYRPRLGRYSCGSRGSVAPRRTELACPFCCTCSIMAGLTLEPWRSKTAEVDWLNLRGGVTRPAPWSAPPAVVTPLGICSVMGRYPADCTLWVVPQSLRDFASNTRPCLAIRHHNTASGQGLLEGTALMVPLVRAMLRLTRAAQPPQEFVVARGV